MDRVIVFVDCTNVFAAAERAGYVVDVGELLEYLADPNEGRMLVEAFAYLGVDPRYEREADITLDALWSSGYLARHKYGIVAGGALVCDQCVEITLDMVRASCEMSPDVVVLVTTDERLVPAVLTLRAKGIRVELASFTGSVSRVMLQRCSSFIDLGAIGGDAVAEETTCATGTSQETDVEVVVDVS